jgi:outer membrane protein assembly factor BamA
VAQIGGIDRALLLRFVAAAVEPLGNAPIAFDELVSPSGINGIRGLPDGLLRDRSGLVGTAEYRWLISSALDASLFVDSGAVARAWFAGLSPEDFRTSVGVGLRFYGRGLSRYWKESASQGVQVAYARGQGLRVMLSIALF